MTPQATLTLRHVLCPINWVKAKIQLEKMKSGEVLVITVDQGQPQHNVPRSARMEGHTVISESPTADGGWEVLIQKK